MNKTTIAGDWKRLKGRIRERWGQITDDDLAKTQGSFEQVVGLIQRKTGEAREEAESFLEEIMDKGQSITDRVASRVQDYATTASETAQEYGQRAMEAAQAGYEGTKDLVRHRPIESLAVCFGVGLVSGILLAFSLRSR